MSNSAVNVKIRSGLSTSDPEQHPVLIIGQAPHLAALTWDDVRCKLEPRVTEEAWRRAVTCSRSAPGEATELWPRAAGLASLPPRRSRHAPPARPHAIAKIVRASTVPLEYIVLVCRKRDALASAVSVARCFPLYSARSAAPPLAAPAAPAAPTAPARQALTVEILLQPDDIGDGETEDEGIGPIDPALTNNTLAPDELATIQDIADNTRLAASIADMPCCVMNTDKFIETAVKVAKELNIEPPTIIRGEELRERGMGGLYGVGRAAECPPALVALSYAAPGATKTVAWVGKGIVYDTGGLSIKARTSMVGMKGDCAGAAAVLGAFAAAVRAGPTVNLHAVLCLAENAVGPKATRPDDIHQLYSGRTVEINNTDAEGRLVLSDGVVYAQRDLKADTIVDVATLTGAQGIATGKYHAAIVSNRAALERQCARAGLRGGDAAHALPFAPELHFPELASALADMRNSVADRNNAQPSCAGLFILAHLGFDFRGDWLHIDMAAPATMDGEDILDASPVETMAESGSEVDEDEFETCDDLSDIDTENESEPIADEDEPETCDDLSDIDTENESEPIADEDEPETCDDLSDIDTENESEPIADEDEPEACDELSDTDTDEFLNSEDESESAVDEDEDDSFNTSDEDESEPTEDNPSLNQNFPWSEDYTSFAGKREDFQQEVGFKIEGTSPLDLFTQIWDSPLLELIVRETNRHAWQTIARANEFAAGIPAQSRLNGWVETSVPEMRRFISLFILMGMCGRERVREYWITGLMGMPKLRQIMSKDRFMLLLRFLHFADDDDILERGEEGKLAKIKPVVDHLNEKFKAIYRPRRELSISPSLVLWDGPFSEARGGRTDVKRSGIHSYELSDTTTGYVLNLIIYTAKSSDLTPLFGFISTPALVVIKLMGDYLDKGHCLLMGGFFNLVLLTRWLKSRKTDLVGPIKKRTVGIPADIKELDEARLKCGETVSRHCGDISVLVWKDDLLVTTMSTFHPPKLVTVRRRGRECQKPAVIVDYNRAMGVIDRKNEELSYLELKIGCKWHVQVFRRLLNSSIMNAYIVYCSNVGREQRMTHSQFRESLAEELSVRAEPRLDRSLQHFPRQIEVSGEKSGKRVRYQRDCCVRCSAKGKRRMTNFLCKQCEVFLCAGRCWREYHTMDVL